MKNFFIQIFIVVVLFNVISSIREIGMLSTWGKDSAPNFVLNTIKQDSEPLISKNKKTILYFFAPWCSVCRVSIKNLQETYQSNKRITIKAIALDYQKAQNVIDFANDLELTFPIFYGNSTVKNAYKVSAYPSYYIVNEMGEVEFRSMGYSTELGLFLRSF